MEERQVVAFHEAGHVTMRCFYSIPTFKFEIDDEGTGMTFAYNEPIWDISVQLDTIMAGMTAEEIFTKKIVLIQSDQDIQDAIDKARGGDQDPDFQTDLDESVEILVRRLNDISDDDVIELVRASYSRCQQILRQHWNVVQALAKAAIDSRDGSVVAETIDAIWNLNAGEH